jgi:hypothetical protein
MVFQIPQNWDVAIDGIQIILCLLILVLIIRSRRKHRQSALLDAIRESGQNFNAHIITLALKQQVDQALANIVETIAVEQRNLDKVLTVSAHANETYGSAQYKSHLHRPTDPVISAIESEASGSDQLHEQIQKLAVNGKSAREISEELKTPLGEVELVLSLHATMGN